MWQHIMDPNTTEFAGLLKNEVDLLDYPRHSEDGEYIHSSAINHVLVVDHCAVQRNIFSCNCLFRSAFFPATK